MPGRLMWWGWGWETFGALCMSLLCLLIHSTPVGTRCSHRALLYCCELRRAISLLHTGCLVFLLGEQGHNTFHPKFNSRAFQGVPWGRMAWVAGQPQHSLALQKAIFTASQVSFVVYTTVAHSWLLSCFLSRLAPLCCCPALGMQPLGSWAKVIPDFCSFPVSAVLYIITSLQQFLRRKVSHVA